MLDVDYGSVGSDVATASFLRSLEWRLRPPLFLIYAENPSDSGKVRFVNFSLKEVSFFVRFNHLFFLGH